jgi:succinate dehydrogenase hydrophobic anchor subunit
MNHAFDHEDSTPTSFEQIVDWIAFAATAIALFMTVLFLIGFVGYAGVKLGLIG